MIQLIIGPMFSGKSTELKRNFERYVIAKKKCIAIKHIFDDRYENNMVCTHNGGKIGCLVSDKLMKLNENVKECDVICIDEGQFFDDLVEFCILHSDKIIIVAGLDSDYRMEGFPNIINLIPKAERVIKLSSICNICGNDAFFSKRLTSEKEINVVGGSNKYIAVCRKCFKL